MLGGNGRSLEPAWTCRFGLKSTRPDSKRNVPSARSVAGRAASPALCSFLEKFTPRRSASAWSPALRMMYHIAFGPKEYDCRRRCSEQHCAGPFRPSPHAYALPSVVMVVHRKSAAGGHISTRASLVFIFLRYLHDHFSFDSCVV